MTLVLFPHQLFAPDHLPEADEIVLVQDRRFFDDFGYHKQKLVLHRASMAAYRDELGDEYDTTLREDDIEEVLADHETIQAFDVVDHAVRDRITAAVEEHGTDVTWHNSPMFLTEVRWFAEQFEDRDYHMADFYREQRKRLDVLMEDGEPVGGKYSFDTENRKKLPDDVTTPELPTYGSGHVDAAIKWVQEHYPDNPGQAEPFIYPVTHTDAAAWLDDFLEDRLANFGDYQDAFEADADFLFHSLLTPMLNIGLLTPDQIVEKTCSYHDTHDVPLNAAEGFIRQVIGWREFVQCIYELEGEAQRASNHWGHSRGLPDAFYTAETGLPPVDAAIERVQQYAYTHHIERLMVLSNIMLLCEIDPDAVYDWFMELFIDAYDWVMVPNVYGMGQYADGGLIMTKPYISSSNYINKMSHYDHGEWEDVWDGLYWRFIHEHREAIEANPRMAVMTSHLDRMGDETLENHLDNAETFLANL